MIDERHYQQLGTNDLILEYLVGAINELNYIRSNLVQPNEFIETRYNWLISIYEDSTGEAADWAN
jgi:hypothetical protein